MAAAEQMNITELRLRKLSSERSPPAPASWDGPIAAVTRRAGLLKAQLGASTYVRAYVDPLWPHISGGGSLTIECIPSCAAK